MNTVRTLPVDARSQASPARALSRLSYIDAVRIILCILVIAVHAAVTYGSLGSWTYEDPRQDETSGIVLSFFVIYSQSFFMGLFFFFSGYFTPASYDRKGWLGFWKDRILRLGIPMALYTWVLCKIPNYINAYANEGLRMSFVQYFKAYFGTVVDEGPTWFLLVVLLFSAGYTLWRMLTARLHLPAVRLPKPTIVNLLVCGLVVGLLTLAAAQLYPISTQFDLFGIFSILFAFFPQYILLFIAGILVYRSKKTAEGDWLARISDRSLRFWGWLSAALILFLPPFLFLGGAPSGRLADFMSGLDWRCIVFTLYIGIATMAFSLTLILWARKHVSADNRLVAFGGPNTFVVYLIHPLVLVPITYGMSFFTAPGLVKFAIAAALTTAVCFALAEAWRRLENLVRVKSPRPEAAGLPQKA